MIKKNKFLPKKQIYTRSINRADDFPMVHFLLLVLASAPTGKICQKLYGNFLYFQAFSWWFFMGLCAGMGQAESRSNPGENAAIPIGIALKILVSAARCQRKARLWKLSQKNGRPLVLTATRQFNAENEVFGMVWAEIWKKLLIRTRCFLDGSRGMCVKCVQIAKNREKARKNAKIAKKSEKMRKVAEKGCKMRQLMGWSASYGVASYWRMYCKISRLWAQSDVLGGRKNGVKN